jgi:K+ transporter
MTDQSAATAGTALDDYSDPHGGHAQGSLRGLALGAAGVVFGDIGTSPL